MAKPRKDAYPKLVTKVCKGCGSKEEILAQDVYDRTRFFFCSDKCVEDYYNSTCKLKRSALAKINLYYTRKAEGWRPKTAKPDTRPERQAARMELTMTKKEAKALRRKAELFKKELAALDADYRKALRAQYGLGG